MRVKNSKTQIVRSSARSHPYPFFFALSDALIVTNLWQTGYYTFGSKVAPGQLLLHDLFDGNARLQTAAEAEAVSLNMPSALSMWDQKITLLPHPTSPGLFIAFTRAFIHQAPDMFTVAMLTSSDGLNLVEVGILWQPQSGHTFYDPHVSIDNSVCPPRYVMSTECVGSAGWASLCLSSSSLPHLPEAWYYPTIFVDAITSPALESASTGVTLTDGMQRYVAWTQVGVRDAHVICSLTLFAGVRRHRRRRSAEPHIQSKCCCQIVLRQQLFRPCHIPRRNNYASIIAAFLFLYLRSQRTFPPPGWVPSRNPTAATLGTATTGVLRITANSSCKD
jgi:hypothetical protein